MKRKRIYTSIILATALFINLQANAQVAINTNGAAPAASAMLDITSTNRGILIPRVSSTGNITSPATGLLVYQTSDDAFYYYFGGVSGSWNKLSSGGISSISTTAPITSTGGSTPTIALTTPLSISYGGTGASSKSAARTSLGAASSGDNADITGLSGLTTALSVSQGGTGVSSFNSGRILFGNGTTNISTSSSLVWVNADGMLGVGRTPLANTLEVEGDASKTTASSWAANSDRNIKRDIQDIDNAYSLMLKLHPVKFKYKAEYISLHPSIKDKFYYNFIAQEFMDVFPESVYNSREKFEGKDILQIDTYNAQILSIKAIQNLINDNSKLQSTINEQQLTIKSLEERLTILEQKLSK